MSWVKVRLELCGKNEVLELDYTSFKTGLHMRKLSDRIILREGEGIIREMPKQNFKDYLVSVISMLDVEDQKEILDSVAEIVFH